MDNEILILDIAYEVRDMLLDGMRMVEAVEFVKDRYGLSDAECEEIQRTARVGVAA
jgi:hypothetical protein